MPADYFPVFDEAAGLPEVPLSPVPEAPAVLPGGGEEPAVPGVDDGELDEAVLPGVVVSVLVPGMVEDGGVVEAVEEGGVVVVVEVVDVVADPACLSQPAMAAPAKARTATTGMSFFMILQSAFE